MASLPDSPTQILDVATRLFARRGFDSTSLQDIAEEVGVTKQTLLYHFASKDALREAVLDHIVSHWRETLPRLVTAFTSGHARFDALAGELIDFFCADPDRALLVAREMLDHPVDLRARFAETLNPWILLVCEYIRQGKQSGVVQPDVDAQAYVLNVITLVVGAVSVLSTMSPVLSRHEPGAEATRQRYLAEVTRLARSALFDPSRRGAAARLEAGVGEPAAASAELPPEP